MTTIQTWASNHKIPFSDRFAIMFQGHLLAFPLTSLLFGWVHCGSPKDLNHPPVPRLPSAPSRGRLAPEIPHPPRPPPPNGRRTRDTHVSRAKIGPGAVLGVTQHLWLCLSGSTPRTGGVPFGCPLQPKRGNSQKMASHSLYPRKTTERVKWLAKLNRTRLKNCENCHPNDSFNVI